MKLDDMMAAVVAERTRELEQKLAETRLREEALRESEERYRSLVEESPDVIGIFQEGRLVFINSTGARRVGARNESELLGRKSEDIIHPDDLPAALARMGRLLGGETGMYPAEVRYVRMDGTTLPAEVSATPTLFRAKIAVQFIARDITERKRTEEALRESENVLRESQVIAGLGSYVLNIPTGRWKSSDVLDKLFGIDDAYERSVEGWVALIHADDRAMMADYFRNEILGQGRAFDKEYRIVRRDDGAERWVHGLGKLGFDSEGHLLKMHGTIQDITDRKRLQEQLIQAQKMDAVGRLAGGVAHDFNNMVQVILGNVELALESVALVGPVRESLEEIQKAARRSAELTQQLLAFARKQAIVPKVLDLNETVEALLNMLRRLIGENIHLAWLPAEGLGPVKVDPTQIHQILANLCVNARDAIGAVGSITISTANAVLDETCLADNPGVAPGEYVRLNVCDEGCGMDKETLSHLFEPFFTTKSVGKGTGLGLAMLYGIVEQNHGVIQVSSEPGKGTTFSIYLPRHAGETAATQRKTAAELPRSRGEAVLLVEDEPTLVSIARGVLERLGYTVLTASTPSAAMRLAETHAGEIHLLLTDVVMPEMNGWDLSRRLSSLRPALKCLFMSGYTADVIALHGVPDQGVHFIPKPFSVEDLAGKVREALGPDLRA